MARGASLRHGARTVWVRLSGRFVSAALVFFALAGCKGEHRASRPLIVVGADGLEWRLLLRFAQEDVLPNITRMMNEGYAGKLETLEPTVSPVVWTTIGTGKLPGQHGITNFWFRDATGKRHLFNSLKRESKAFWNLLAEADQTCHVEGWWCTWPVEDLGDGSMVAQTSTRAQIDIKSGRIWKGTYLKGLPGQIWPETRTAAMDAHVDALAEAADAKLAATFGGAAHSKSPPSPLTQMLWKLVAQSYFGDELFLDAARDVLAEKRPFDLLALYVGVTDVASHMFWRHFEPEVFAHPPTAEEVADFGHVIRDSYRFVDAAIGELRAGAPDADFILLSDHGFHAVNRELDFDPSYARKKNRIESGHHLDAPPGVFIACGPSFRKSPVVVGTDVSLLRTVGRVQDVLPTLLVLKDIAIASDFAGQPMRQLFTEETIANHPIRTVATHDDADWKAQRETSRKNYERFEKNFQSVLEHLDSETTERLKRLGYVFGDADPDDPTTGDDDATEPPHDGNHPDDPAKKGDGK